MAADRGIVRELHTQGMDAFLAAAFIAFGTGLMAEDLPDLLPGV